MLAALSVETAFNTIAPNADGVNVNVYGALLATPSETLLAKNSTCETVPSASAAVAEIVITAVVPVKIALLRGLTIATVGGMLLTTQKVRVEEVPTAPRLSVADAFKPCDPKVAVHVIV